jgi:hypothetical protein
MRDERFHLIGEWAIIDLYMRSWLAALPKIGVRLLMWTSPRKSLVKGERFIRFEEIPEHTL